IYNLDVVVIPSNRPLARRDMNDLIYLSMEEKFEAIVKDIKEFSSKGAPVLVGTASIDTSELLSRHLTKEKIEHEVLNAKFHEREAQIVAQAGRPGVVTIATNMAGRGTDIVLGGNVQHEIAALGDVTPEQAEELREAWRQRHQQVMEAGGLHVIGTERHESRRIDNQLRGRAGRQGDPGYSRFYLSLEDDLMRIFMGDRVKSLMDRMGMPDDEPIEHPLVTRSIENAQRKVEERNFDIRKNLLEYDDVMNAQRKTVYSLRQQLLTGRYSPDEIDETGKSTGKPREIPIDPEIAEQVEPQIATIVGYFCDPQIHPLGDDKKPRPPTREELEKAEKLVDPEVLRHEVYEAWGTRLELLPRKTKAPIEVYDELIDLVPRGLSEQRERLLDLIDRVVAAMVEESCPENRPPEDWDWDGMFQGFEEHFKVRPDPSLAELGDRDLVVKRLYELAQQHCIEKEAELGLENTLRVFRHMYVEAIDEAWVDHLSNMEHLRDGIGLRGYGQRDPKNEYKKEAYILFVTMMAKVSSNVLVRLFEARPRRREELAAAEAEAARRYQEELEQAIARHPSTETADPSTLLAELERVVQQAAAPARPTPQRRREGPKIGRNDPCPCGSGKKFKKCHGAALEDETTADGDEDEEQQPRA